MCVWDGPMARLNPGLIGTAGFEPATPATPLQCATGLRYVPELLRSVIVPLPPGGRKPRKVGRPVTCDLSYLGPKTGV